MNSDIGHLSNNPQRNMSKPPYIIRSKKPSITELPKKSQIKHINYYSRVPSVKKENSDSSFLSQNRDDNLGSDDEMQTI